MKKMIIACVISLLSFVGCKDGWAGDEWGRWMANNSDKTIMATFSFKTNEDGFYPTTEWPDEAKIYTIPPGEERIYGLPWRQVRDKDNGYVAFYVFDPDTVAKYTWEELERDQNYLMRKVFRMSEFEYTKEGVSFLWRQVDTGRSAERPTVRVV